MTDPYRQTLCVSWDEFHHLSRLLAERLQALGSWRLLVAVTRGGLVPAAIVARELDLRLVDTLCIASYDGRQQSAARVLKAADASDGADVLVVDDLVDTGATAAVMRRLLPRAHFATVFAKPKGRALADSFVTEVGQDTWIVLPWDQHPPIAAPRC